MAKSDKEKLADALARLASGEHPVDESDHSSGASHLTDPVVDLHGSTQPPATQQPPATHRDQQIASTTRKGGAAQAPVAKSQTRPQPPPHHPGNSASIKSAGTAGSSTKAVPPSAARGAQPAKTQPPRNDSAQIGTSKPSRPARPSTPLAARSASTSAPPVYDPAAPTGSAFDHLTESSEPVDDEVDAPAPQQERLARIVPTQSRKSLFASLSFRRTIIPVLLTNAVILMALAIAWLSITPTSGFAPLRERMWFPLATAVAGLVLLGLAILNMLWVRAETKGQRSLRP